MDIKKAEKNYIYENIKELPSCHASTLVKYENGDILASWFGGIKEGDPDEAIFISKRSNGEWSAPVKVCDEENVVHWNPVLFFDENDKVTYLFYKVDKPIQQWFTRVVKSYDYGITWTEPVELVKDDIGGRGPVKNKPIRLSNNSIICPASIETETQWDAFCDITKDMFKTMEKTDFVEIIHPKDGCDKSDKSENEDLLYKDNPNYCGGRGVIQPTLWESENGNVHMLLRSTGGFIFRSDSKDYGKTWSKAYKTALLSNNSGIDLVKHENGAIYLVYTPKSIKERFPLNLAVSYDNGSTFKDILMLETHDYSKEFLKYLKENDPKEKGHFAYPAIICNKNSLYITYTWNRKKIAFWEIELEMI